MMKRAKFFGVKLCQTSSCVTANDGNRVILIRYKSQPSAPKSLTDAHLGAFLQFGDTISPKW